MFFFFKWSWYREPSGSMWKGNSLPPHLMLTAPLITVVLLKCPHWRIYWNQWTHMMYYELKHADQTWTQSKLIDLKPSQKGHNSSLLATGSGSCSYLPLMPWICSTYFVEKCIPVKLWFVYVQFLLCMLLKKYYQLATGKRDKIKCFVYLPDNESKNRKSKNVFWHTWHSDCTTGRLAALRSSRPRPLLQQDYMEDSPFQMSCGAK